MFKQVILLSVSFSISVWSVGEAWADVCTEIHEKADRFSRDQTTFEAELKRADASKPPHMSDPQLCFAGAAVLADLEELGKVTASKCFKSLADFREAVGSVTDAIASTRAIGGLHGCRF